MVNLPRHSSAGLLQTVLISLPASAAHAIQVSGHCFSLFPGSSQAVPACLPESAARVLGLAAGDVVTLREPATHARLRVLITAPSGGPVRAALTGGSTRSERARCSAPQGSLSPGLCDQPGHDGRDPPRRVGEPDRHAGFRPDGTGLAALGTHLATTIDGLNRSGSVDNATITTGLTGELQSLATALVVARTKILAGMMALLVIGGATLRLAARLLAERWAAETALIGQF